MVGVVGREDGGEHGLAVWSQEALGDERGDGGADGFLADRDARVVGVERGSLGLVGSWEQT